MKHGNNTNQKEKNKLLKILIKSINTKVKKLRRKEDLLSELIKLETSNNKPRPTISKHNANQLKIKEI